ncbi:hypothetical protein ACNJYA_02695 [Bradyrhizobium sp. DASA03068]|uniref:hypothetical protein n=1 Tax=Bradyrhizobium sp. BLXBL-01 TaxID=3395915 RepID=UPI003F72BA0F
MDLGFIRAHLAQAERHVALSDEHIARQLEIIDALERAGGSTDLALDVLTTYRMLRASHVEHRDMIRRELGM